MSISFGRLFAAAALLAALGSPALAGGPAYCADYAQAAVIAAHRNFAHGCGYDGPRWSAAFGVHYAWCRSVPPPLAMSERIARREGMIACLGHP